MFLTRALWSNLSILCPTIAYRKSIRRKVLSNLSNLDDLFEEYLFTCACVRVRMRVCMRVRVDNMYYKLDRLDRLGKYSIFLGLQVSNLCVMSNLGRTYSSINDLR